MERNQGTPPDDKKSLARSKNELGLEALEEKIVR